LMGKVLGDREPSLLSGGGLKDPAETNRQMQRVAG
jgi:hypothetical protein